MWNMRLAVFSVAIFAVLLSMAVWAGSCDQASETNAEPQSVQPETPRLFPVRIDGKFGYIDRFGDVVLQPQFDLASAFHEDRATVMIRSEDDQQLYSVINGQGDTIVAPQLNQIARYSEGRAVFVDAQTSKRGYVDSEGAVAIPALFDTASEFRSGVAHVLVITIGEDEMLRRAASALSGLPPEKAANPDAIGWNDLGIPVQHYYIDRSGTRLGDIDVDDEQPDRWIMVRNSTELLERKHQGKYGFVNEAEEFVIEAQFEAASEFSEGLAAVRIGGRWGFINRDGKVVVAPKWSFALPFRGGLAEVTVEDGRTGYINSAGEYVWRPSK